MFKFNQTSNMTSFGVGCYGNAQFGPTSGTHYGDITGTGELVGTIGLCSVKWNQVNSGGYPNIANCSGVSAVWNNLSQSAGATVTNLCYFHGYKLGANLYSGKVTNVHGLWLETITQAGSTNNYGIKIDDISGATNNYAIKTGAGDVDFGATVIMMGSLPTSDPSNTGQLWNNGGILTVS